MFGMRLLGHGDECLVCGSILQTLWFCFRVPLIPVGRFRVVYQMGDGLFPTGYIGRKLISEKEANSAKAQSRPLAPFLKVQSKCSGRVMTE